jgi:Flp pilus assembly protein TadD
VEAWYALGELHAKRGEPDAARDALEAGLALAPRHLPSLTLLARVSGELGDRTRARALLEQAAALAPRSHAIRASLVRARREEAEAAAVP